ncbi:MAG: hypothetical protein HY874_11740 [Chloroflexi bacterium]|nr:hypothetical protein [Chloroflexota bacterium]
MNRLKTAAALLVMTAVIGGAALTGAASSPQPAAAAPTAMLALNGGSCLPLAIAFGGLTSFQAAGSCENLQKQTPDATGSFQVLVSCLRGDDLGQNGTIDCVDTSDVLKVTPDDFKPMDLDKNQVRDNGKYLYVFAFVDDDAPVRFITDKGVFDNFLGLTAGTGKDYYCETANVQLAPFTGDPDCDNDPSTEGDGVVVARIRVDDTDELGPGHVTAIQEGIGFPLEFTVTGNFETIKVAPLFGKDTIQTGATIPPATGSSDPKLDTDCAFGASLSAVLAAIGHESKTVVIAKVLDNDGTELSGSLLAWDKPFNADNMRAEGGVSTPQTPTLDLGGSIGIGFPQFVCGGQTEGELKIKVTFDDTVPGGKTGEYVNAVINVVGPAANIALTADPAVIDCDGVNTSKVTATVTQADGKPVANGLDVNFKVQVLGTNSPLKGDAAGGEASTTVTPLRGTAQTGVPVVVTADDVQASILVKCSGVVPPAAGESPAGGSQGGAAAPGRPGTISGPDTGMGVPAGRGALSWWPVLGLAAAATALLAARSALKRN